MEQNTQAWNDNKDLSKSIIDSIKAVEASIKQLNKTVEGQVTKITSVEATVKKMLENEKNRGNC